MGIPLMRTKTWAYAGGAFFGGVAGAYYASAKDSVTSDDFFFNISVFILCMVILGGMGNVWGVLAGAAFLAYLNKEGLADIGAWINAHIHVFGYRPNIDVPLYETGIYGVIIVVVMLWRPEGLLPSKRRARELHETETAGHAALRPPARGGVMAEENILVAEDLRKEFGGLVAVNNVNFAVPRGKVVSLIGPNGAGKTTFFNMLTGVYKPTVGQGDLPRRGRHRQAAARDHRPRCRADVPEHQALRRHDDARERPRRDALAAEGEHVHLGPPHARRQGRGGQGAGEGARAAPLRRPASSTRTSSPAASPTATSAGSRWRGRSRPSRSSCCSTSRRPA